MANGVLFPTVVSANSEAEAFCKGRLRAEQWYLSNGVHCVSTESINHPESYVKPYIEPTKEEMLEMFAEMDLMGI
ncbi:MAG: hypothetical protein WCK10_03470 [Candidatus Staskawiczbacteria bacterium]